MFACVLPRNEILQIRMSRWCGLLSGVVALTALVTSALLADNDDARCLALFGRDYENHLCGQLGKRDLRSRPFLYFLQPANSSTAVCVHACPRLADDIICDYGYDGAAPSVQRAQLGQHCFGRLRTRAVFLSCMPTDPAAVGVADAWLSAHTWDQLAADMLQATNPRSAIVYSTLPAWYPVGE